MFRNPDVYLGIVIGVLIAVLLMAVINAVAQQNSYTKAHKKCIATLVSEGVERSEITTFKGKCYLGAY